MIDGIARPGASAGSGRDQAPAAVGEPDASVEPSSDGKQPAGQVSKPSGTPSPTESPEPSPTPKEKGKGGGQGATSSGSD